MKEDGLDIGNAVHGIVDIYLHSKAEEVGREVVSHSRLLAALTLPARLSLVRQMVGARRG